MTRVLVVAVVVAQLLDVVTWMAMPQAAEVNPLAQGLHSSTGWLLKALLLVVVIGIQPALRPKYAAVGELVAVIAIAAGCIGAGSNLAVLTVVRAAEAPRPALLVIPVDALRASPGVEHGASNGTDAGRTPAPLPESAGSRRSRPLDVARGTVGVLVSRSATLRGTASWYRQPGLVAAAGLLSDWCQCYRGQRRERLVDLSDGAFSAIAPLVAGLVEVTVRPSRLRPPATDR